MTGAGRRPSSPIRWDHSIVNRRIETLWAARRQAQARRLRIETGLLSPPSGVDFISLVTECHASSACLLAMLAWDLWNGGTSNPVRQLLLTLDDVNRHDAMSALLTFSRLHNF